MIRAIISLLAILVLASAAIAGPHDTPVVDAAELIASFTSNYDGASSQCSDLMIFDIQGKILSAKVYKKPGGETYAEVQVGARRGSSIPIDVGFPAKMNDDVEKLKKGDLIQVRVSYGAIPDSPPLSEIRGFAASQIISTGPDDQPAKLRKQLVDWIVKNNTLPPGPGNPLVQDMSAKIDEMLPTGDDFAITIGPGLVNSGHLTALSVQDGKMLPVEFTADQTAAKKFPAKSLTIHNAKSDVISLPTEAVIETPVFSNAGKWNPDEPLAGTIKIKRLTNFPADSATDSPDYAIRAATFLGDSHMDLFSHFYGAPGNGIEKIQFGALAKDDPLRDPKEAGPRVMYFELVRTVKDGTGGVNVEVISDPVAAVIEIAAKE